MDKSEILKRAKEYISEEKDTRFSKEIEELIAKEDYKELEDRFYQTLEFGTGGLRGIMGGGTNRMNTLEINKATQGLANYVLKAFPEKAKDGSLSAVVAYDSRLNSDVFAEATALIFAANGIKAYLFSGLRPTPELSYAIRKLGAQTGVVVTASHNPRMYNGYKAYWDDGAQVIEPHDKGIIEEVNKVTSVKTMTKDEAISSGKLVLIDKEIDEPFWDMCKAQLFRPQLIKEKAKDVRIVYTPLHGTGAMHVEKVLGDLGLNILTAGLSKSHAMTGYRLGYVAAPAKIMANISKMHAFLVTTVTNNVQVAAAEALTNGLDDPLEFRKIYQHRRDLLVAGLKELGFEMLTPEGAFYLFAKIPTQFGTDDVAFAKQLAKEAKVGVTPGSAFGKGGDGYVRLSYASSDENLTEAIKRIGEFLNHLA